MNCHFVAMFLSFELRVFGLFRISGFDIRISASGRRPYSVHDAGIIVPCPGPCSKRKWQMVDREGQSQ